MTTYQSQSTRVRQLFSTLAAATASNPVLLEGEKWNEKDATTGRATGRSKTGDGVVTGGGTTITGTAFNDLPFDPSAGDGASLSYATAAQGALAVTAVQPAELSGYQPLDSDLTAIAALSTTAAGRSLLALAAVPTDALVGTTDTQTLTNKTLGNVRETIFTITDAAGFAINPANGPIQVVTLGANRTPTASSFAAGQSVTLMVDDGTAYAITWTTVGVSWVGGSAPTLATTGYTVIELWKVGSQIYGALVGIVA